MRLTSSFIQNGKMDNPHDARRIGHGNAMRPTLRSTRLRITQAALSASMKNGIGHVFRSVMRERTNPGQTTETLIPSGFNMPRSASPHVLTQAFVAEYAGQLFKGP